ncbi:MAG: peptidoglycan editing factor PgeF [Betaproteobacteria bacterium]
MSRAPAASLAERLRTDGLDWIVPDWPAPPQVRAFATTRHGGASAGAYATLNLGRKTVDDPAAVVENHRRVASYLPSPPVWLEQVHGSAVVTLGPHAPHAPPIADAAVTRQPGVVCAVLTADCLPVVFANRAGTAVGIAHAGWRGLAAGVLEATVAAMAASDARPGDLFAWLGPAIGPAAFEVGADVVDAFCAADPGAIACFAPHRAGKWHADLAALARRRLAAAGVTHIGGGGFCTHADGVRFFSYRRERASGRMAAVVWLDAAAV